MWQIDGEGDQGAGGLTPDAALPPGWARVPLNELLAGIETGKSFKCDERPPGTDEVGVVKVSAVSWGEYREQESKTCMDATRVNAGLYIRPGDFLFSRANTIDLVGACVIARQVNWRVMLSDKIFRFNFAGDNMKDWVLHYLRSQAGRTQIEELASGNQESMRNIGQERVGQVRVPLPPKEERAKIIDKLDELLSELMSGRDELANASRKLKQYRQALLKAAVEGDLTAEWRADNPPQETGAELLTRILRERRARWEAQLGMRRKYAEPTGVDPSGAANLPSGWCWASIDELADVGTGVTPLRTDSRYFDSGTVPWVTSGALNAERVLEPSSLVTEVALEECRLVMYPAGSLLVAMYGEGKTRGKCAELGIAATINQAIAALVFKGFAVACREYVKAFLWHSYERMRQQASGGVQPNLNLQIIKTLAVPLPPLPEQETIVLALNAQLEAMREHEAAIARGLRLAAAQRQNILRAAFSGQLVPQDPNDEPAGVLLERIRAERAAAYAASPRPLPRRRARQSAAP